MIEQLLAVPLAPPSARGKSELPLGMQKKKGSMIERLYINQLDRSRST
jgi:hypothetical protein